MRYARIYQGKADGNLIPDGSAILQTEAFFGVDSVGPEKPVVLIRDVQVPRGEPIRIISIIRKATGHPDAKDGVARADVFVPTTDSLPTIDLAAVAHYFSLGAGKSVPPYSKDEKAQDLSQDALRWGNYSSISPRDLEIASAVLAGKKVLVVGPFPDAYRFLQALPAGKLAVQGQTKTVSSILIASKLTSIPDDKVAKPALGDFSVIVVEKVDDLEVRLKKSGHRVFRLDQTAVPSKDTAEHELPQLLFAFRRYNLPLILPTSDSFKDTAAALTAFKNELQDAVTSFTFLGSVEQQAKMLIKKNLHRNLQQGFIPTEFTLQTSKFSDLLEILETVCIQFQKVGNDYKDAVKDLQLAETNLDKSRKELDEAKQGVEQTGGESGIIGLKKTHRDTILDQFRQLNVVQELFARRALVETYIAEIRELEKQDGEAKKKLQAAEKKTQAGKAPLRELFPFKAEMQTCDAYKNALAEQVAAILSIPAGRVLAGEGSETLVPISSDQNIDSLKTLAKVRMDNRKAFIDASLALLIAEEELDGHKRKVEEMTRHVAELETAVDQAQARRESLMDDMNNYREMADSPREFRWSAIAGGDIAIPLTMVKMKANEWVEEIQSRWGFRPVPEYVKSVMEAEERLKKLHGAVVALFTALSKKETILSQVATSLTTQVVAEESSELLDLLSQIYRKK